MSVIGVEWDSSQMWQTHIHRMDSKMGKTYEHKSLRMQLFISASDAECIAQWYHLNHRNHYKHTHLPI